MSESELAELNYFIYPSSVDALGWNGVPGWAPNYPHTNPQTGTTGGNTSVILVIIQYQDLLLLL